MNVIDLRNYKIPLGWLCPFKLELRQFNTTLTILTFMLLTGCGSAHIQPMSSLVQSPDMITPKLDYGSSKEPKELRSWRPPYETPQYLASNVVTRMEETPGIYEATAKRFFEVLRMGASQRPKESVEEAASRRASESNPEVLHKVGEALIGKLRFAVDWYRPGAIDHFTKRVYDDQKVNVCMSQIWWSVAVERLVPFGLPEHELEAFYNVLNFVDPCKKHSLGLVKRNIQKNKREKEQVKKKQDKKRQVKEKQNKKKPDKTTIHKRKRIEKRLM